jgi:hypothetical protein
MPASFRTHASAFVISRAGAAWLRRRLPPLRACFIERRRSRVLRRRRGGHAAPRQDGPRGGARNESASYGSSEKTCRCARCRPGSKRHALWTARYSGRWTNFSACSQSGSPTKPWRASSSDGRPRWLGSRALREQFAAIGSGDQPRPAGPRNGRLGSRRGTVRPTWSAATSARRTCSLPTTQQVCRGCK